jgi:hypothetical protein
MKATGFIRLADSAHGSRESVLDANRWFCVDASFEGAEKALITTITRLARMIRRYPIKNVATRSANTSRNRLMNKSPLSTLGFRACISVGMIIAQGSRESARATLPDPGCLSKNNRLTIAYVTSGFHRSVWIQSLQIGPSLQRLARPTPGSYDCTLFTSLNLDH